jgi:hypothetical protein
VPVEIVTWKGRTKKDLALDRTLREHEREQPSLCGVLRGQPATAPAISAGLVVLLLKGHSAPDGSLSYKWHFATVMRKATKSDRVVDEKGKVLKKTPKNGAWLVRRNDGGVDGVLLTPGQFKSTRPGSGWCVPATPADQGTATAASAVTPADQATATAASASLVVAGAGDSDDTSSSMKHQREQSGRPRAHDSPPRKRTVRETDPTEGSVCIYHVLTEPRDYARVAMVMSYSPSTRSLLLWHMTHNSAGEEQPDRPLNTQKLVSLYNTYDKNGEEQSLVTPSARERLPVLSSVVAYTVDVDVEIIVPVVTMIPAAHYARVSEADFDAVEAWLESEHAHESSLSSSFNPVASMGELGTGRRTVLVVGDGHCAFAAVTLGLLSISKLPFDAGAHLRAGLGPVTGNDIFQMRSFIAAQWKIYLNKIYFLLKRGGAASSRKRIETFNAKLRSALESRSSQITLSEKACGRSVGNGDKAWMGACDFAWGGGSDFRLVAMATSTPIFIMDAEYGYVYEYREDGTHVTRVSPEKGAASVDIDHENDDGDDDDGADDGDVVVQEEPEPWRCSEWTVAGDGGHIPMRAFPLRSVVLLKSPMHYDASIAVVS